MSDLGHKLRDAEAVEGFTDGASKIRRRKHRCPGQEGCRDTGHPCTGHLHVRLEDVLNYLRDGRRNFTTRQASQELALLFEVKLEERGK
jgi:hypothetical protein